jgi:hypothetical protein
MKKNIKPITKQLLIAAIILSSVTVLSFGIRHVRFSAYRANSGQSTPSARPSDTEDQSQSEQRLNVDAESDYYQDNSFTIDDEQGLQYAYASYWDEEIPTDDNSEENTDSTKYDKAVSKTKSFKGDYAKSEGKKGPQKVSLGDYENLYRTKEGEYWYVSEQPDGSTTKMQVQIDEIGELTVVGGGSYGKQGPQRISIGDSADIYLTDEGEAWYVSEQPDGETVKMQVQPD